MAFMLAPQLCMVHLSKCAHLTLSSVGRTERSKEHNAKDTTNCGCYGHVSCGDI